MVIAVNTKFRNPRYTWFAGVLCWPAGHSFADGIVVPAGDGRNDGPARSAVEAIGSVALDVERDRVEGQLGVVALANEHSERPIALAPVTHWRGKPPTQEIESAFEFVPVAATVVVVLSQRLLDKVGTDSAREQPPPDPVASPCLELALVLDEQSSEPRVVKVALLDQGRDRALDVVWNNVCPPEMRAQLRLRAIAPVQVAVGSVKGLIEAI